SGAPSTSSSGSSRRPSRPASSGRLAGPLSRPLHRPVSPTFVIPTTISIKEVHAASTPLGAGRRLRLHHRVHGHRPRRPAPTTHRRRTGRQPQIGRASCRERGSVTVLGGGVERKEGKRRDKN